MGGFNITQASNSVELNTYGGLVTLARPENCPEGASPRNYDMDYPVGNAQTRPGTESYYTYAAGGVGPNPASSAVNVAITGNAWANPSYILANDGNYASCGQATGNSILSGSDALNVTEFGFSLPSTVLLTGFPVNLTGYASTTTTVTAQLLIGGVPRGAIKTATLTPGVSTITFGAVGDMWGLSLAYSDVNATTFGVQFTVSSIFSLATAYLGYVTIGVGLTTGAANFNFITTMVAQDGTVRNLLEDADGNLWVENVTANPRVLALALEGITPNSFCTGVNGPDVEYLSFSDLTTGADIPRQYTSGWIDRISQVGPGASPVFTPSGSSATTFAITSITQPSAQIRGFSYFLQSTGPGSTSPGNVATVYYSDSTIASADADLVAAFNSGFPVYIYTSFTGTSDTIGPYVQQVTSVGLASPPGQPRQFYYFTYSLATTAYIFHPGSGHAGYSANYQRSLATLTTAVPVPGLTVGNRITVTGTTPSAWDAQWTITQTLNSGAMAITATSVTSGVATYTYSVVSGSAPVAGQLVTITGTLNAVGGLNLVNATIASSTGGASGTFTVAVGLPDFTSEVESGQAATAGTEFAFDPGADLVTTSTDPIFGSGSGGTLTFAGSGQFIGPGTRQGVCGFITRNGYYTAPSAPVTFTTPDNTTNILVSNLPIGPPNVVARYVAFTEAGQNGVPGANFFIIPTPVVYIVANVSYTANQTIVNDNTSTTATFAFSDNVLLNAEAIDIQGNNLFNLIEIGNPGWIAKYSDRNFYGLCQNKIQNFTNLSFDGGYLPSTQPTPLGWSTPDAYGTLLVSPVFGNSYYITNTSGSTQTTLGLISQTAYQDAYQQPILNPNTAYSVRVTARVPSGSNAGNLVVDLMAAGISYGQFLLPFASMTTTMAIYSGTLLTTELPTVPAMLLLRCYAQNILNSADVEIDRIEVFPTAIPVLATAVYSSYANDLESVDAISGKLVVASENQEPVYTATVLYDTLYFRKSSSTYSTQATANLEPAYWPINEVSQKAGSCGILACDTGEQWTVSACRNGIYLFEGGTPGKLMQEIYQIWDALNWNAGNSIWVRNDVPSRRLFVGVPLPTPNFWLPNAPVNPAPASPNVILMMNYQGLDTGEEIQKAPQMHTTMFGTLNAVDMRRKWSIWQIPSPYMGIVAAPDTGNQILICNGKASSKVYAFAPYAAGQIPTDDGAVVNSLYTTYAFVSATKSSSYPLLGMFRKLWNYMYHQFAGAGVLNVTAYAETLAGPTDDTTNQVKWNLPAGFQLTDPCYQMREAPFNFQATKTFIEFSTTGHMICQGLILQGRKNPWNQIRGVR